MASNSNSLVFADSNVLIEALFGYSEDAKTIINLAIRGWIDLLTCQLVVEDVKDEIVDQLQDMAALQVILNAWDYMLTHSRIHVLPDPSQSDVQRVYQ